MRNWKTGRWADWVIPAALMVVGGFVMMETPCYGEDLSARRAMTTFIIVGDTQRTSLWEFWREQNDAARQALLDEVAAENPAFLIHLGDLVFRGASARQWKRFDEVSASIRQHGIPVFPILGNHEYYGGNKRAFQNLSARFPSLSESAWRAFSFHSLGIVLLNSNLNNLTETQRQEQHNWYLRQLNDFQNDPAITTILVAAHHPPYTNSRVVHDDMRVREAFVGAFLATPKARLFFSGHCHGYEHFMVGGKHFIVSGGGGGPRHRLKVLPKDEAHQDVYAGQLPRPFEFCRVTVLPDDVRVQMVQLDGATNEWSVGDEFVVH